MEQSRDFKSLDSGKEYTLRFTAEGKFLSCTCPHYQMRLAPRSIHCKHVKQLKEFDEAQLIMQLAIMKHFEKNWVLDFAAELDVIKPDEIEDVPVDTAAGF